MWNPLRHCIFLLMAGLPLPSISLAQLTLPPDTQAPTPAQSVPGQSVPGQSRADKARVEGQISESLRGRGPFGEGQSSGDPILDDVLDVIRQRGSVVDGSILDPMLDLKSELQDDGEWGKLSSVYLAAESLLKSARILEGLSDQSSSRLQLIRSMRSEATKLLIDAVSRESQPQGSQLQGMTP
jgi:hypothetical protein